MRKNFPTQERAKKAAKSLARVIDGVTLPAAQEAIARLAGARDWNDLINNNVGHSRSSLNANQQDVESTTNVIALAFGVSEELGVGFGDALYGVSRMNLPGTPIESAQAYEELWLELFKETQDLQDDKRSPGKVISIKNSMPRWNGKNAILKKYGSSTLVITHGVPVLAVADHDVVFPRTPLSLFVPARLKLAYGYWTEEDESRVLFSRDYIPLWRLTAGRKPERLRPWLRINCVEEQWFWDDTNTPWQSDRRLGEEERRLIEFGISALPMLADALSPLVLDENVPSVRQAVDWMAQRA